MSRSDDPFDTYLLRVFGMLMAERSVSRAATRLNQSQPAIGNALKRLREIFDDPLLIKDKQRLVPTERALQLEASVRVVLGEIDALLAPGDVFDPATTRQTFRIGAPDYLAPPLMAAVVQYLRSTAPGARMLLQPLGSDYDYDAALADGELDVVIGNWPQPPEHLRTTLLLEDEIVCLVDRDHPGASGMKASDYLQGAHVVPLLYSGLQRGVVETHLAAQRLTRTPTVTVPYFAMAPHLLPGTDLIFTTSRHFALHFAAMLPLAVVPAPIDFPPMRFYQLWHGRNQHAAGHTWLRSLLSAVMRTASATRHLRVSTPAAPDLRQFA
ncbi:LysR family transcriptional regulator [Variovorax sp. J22P168]|uniref:LysR family transcriptional regulator n=1 Tax=Variovorax jilinensis TaxID=3053513 RepID=UPI0025751CBA|nr:LysR family transcriptional regulator [Variovorax sp. J22P168]MDM0013581.1 LysR family transcriptional regulator [Variovorax sp. J22P168]